MGTLFFISSSNARLLIENPGANTCSLTPSEWIGAVGTTGGKKADRLFTWAGTGGITRAVWFSSHTRETFSSESLPLFLRCLLIRYSLPYFLVSVWAYSPKSHEIATFYGMLLSLWAVKQAHILKPTESTPRLWHFMWETFPLINKVNHLSLSKSPLFNFMWPTFRQIPA